MFAGGSRLGGNFDWSLAKVGEKTVGFIGLIEKDLINHNRTPDVAV